MIKKNPDGTKLYYYYKKKIGRHKKPGKKSRTPTKHACIQEAKKYKTYSEFKKNAHSTYLKCLHSNLLTQFTWLEDDRVSVYKDKIDCVYMYMFENHNTVYIGRTLMKRKHKRDYEHLFSNDCVVKFCKEKKTPLPKMTILEENLTLKEGLEREDYYVHYYKNLGYNILNIAKTGLGSGSIGRIPRKCVVIKK